MTTTHIIVVSGCLAWVLSVVALLSIFTVAGRAERIAEGWDELGHDPRQPRVGGRSSGQAIFAATASGVFSGSKTKGRGLVAQRRATGHRENLTQNR